MRIAVAPPAHVADTDDNRPYERQRDARRFLRAGNLAIPRRYGARYVLLDRRRGVPDVGGTIVYSDARYRLSQLAPPSGS